MSKQRIKFKRGDWVKYTPHILAIDKGGKPVHYQHCRKVKKVDYGIMGAVRVYYAKPHDGFDWQTDLVKCKKGWV